MALPTPTNPPELIIDLGTPLAARPGHRLAELVQALTGCGIERAELAVSDPIPGPVSTEDALRTMAKALVRLRARQPVPG